MESVSVVKRNIIANTIGGIWVLALGLLLVPTQFKILGSEIVGLLGFVATIQTIFSVFDFGLAPTILREVASDNSSEREISRELIQTVSVVYWLVAIILGLSLVLLANWFTKHWLTLDTLTQNYAIISIRMLALRMLIAWPLKLYVNILSGIQRLDIVNTLRVFTQTVVIVGGIIILLIWGNLHFFLLWTIFIGVLSLILHIVACYRYFPKISLIPKFSVAAIRRTWRFSLDMNILSFQGILLTQIDNMMVSYLMPLRMLGYYTGAYSLNQQSLQTFSGFLSDAMLPTLSKDFGHGHIDQLKQKFQKYTQIVTYFSMIPTGIFVFWGYDVLRIWTTLDVAAGAYTTLAILSFGFLLHATMIPYLILCVSTKNTRMPRNVNWAGLGVYLICCYLFILRWGINGAALAWVLLNIYYLFTILPFTQTNILNDPPFAWVNRNFLRFFLLACAWFGLGRFVLELQPFNHELIIWSICFISVMGYSLSGFFSLERILQNDILQTIVSISNIAGIPLKFNNRD